MTTTTLDAPRALSPTNTYVPLAAVLGAAIMAGSAVLWYQSDRAKLDDQIRSTDKRIDALVANVDKLTGTVGRLAEALTEGRDDRLSRQDLDLWCLQAERVNRDTFLCPNSYGVAMAGGAIGWLPQMPRAAAKRR